MRSGVGVAAGRDFVGLAANGTWMVCLGDGGAGDTGTLHSVQLVVNKSKFDLTP